MATNEKEEKKTPKETLIILASLCSEYYGVLLEQGIPAELAGLMVRDMNMAYALSVFGGVVGAKVSYQHRID